MAHCGYGKGHTVNMSVAQRPYSHQEGTRRAVHLLIKCMALEIAPECAQSLSVKCLAFAVAAVLHSAPQSAQWY